MSADNSIALKKRFRLELQEDHWAVLIGGVLIAAVLSILFATGFKFTVPVYNWSNSSELTGKVLSAGNLLILFVIGLAFAFLSSIAIVLSGGNARRFIAGFALIYVLGLLSLIIAGNKTISRYGVEYVMIGSCSFFFHQ